MSKHLKYSAVILVCVVILVVTSRVGNCSDRATDEISVRIPSDSGFVPVTERNYRPRSTPFERPLKSPAKLPKGVTEGDVARTVAVVKRIPIDFSHFLTDTTSLVLMKDGLVFVQKQPGIAMSVEDTKFIDPIFHWDIFTSIGISIAKFGVPTLEVSPSIAIAPLEIMGKVQLPLLAADLTGVGIGIAYRHKNFIFALAGHERFVDAGRSIQIMIHYSI